MAISRRGAKKSSLGVTSGFAGRNSQTKVVSKSCPEVEDSPAAFATVLANGPRVMCLDMLAFCKRGLLLQKLARSTAEVGMFAARHFIEILPRHWRCFPELPCSSKARCLVLQKQVRIVSYPYEVPENRYRSDTRKVEFRRPRTRSPIGNRKKLLDGIANSHMHQHLVSEDRKSVV